MSLPHDAKGLSVIVAFPGNTRSVLFLTIRIETLILHRHLGECLQVVCFTSEKVSMGNGNIKSFQINKHVYHKI